MENKHITHTIDKFEDYLLNLGYENVTHDILPVSYITNRGRLFAKGEFSGPSPYNKETRNVEDVSSYTYFIVGDLDYEDVISIEVKHFSAIIATFKIMPDGVYTLDGELPSVRDVG